MLKIKKIRVALITYDKLNGADSGAFAAVTIYYCTRFLGLIFGWSTSSKGDSF